MYASTPPGTPYAMEQPQDPYTHGSGTGPQRPDSMYSNPAVRGGPQQPPSQQHHYSQQPYPAPPALGPPQSLSYTAHKAQPLPTSVSQQSLSSVRSSDSRVAPPGEYGRGGGTTPQRASAPDSFRHSAGPPYRSPASANGHAQGNGSLSKSAGAPAGPATPPAGPATIAGEPLHDIGRAYSLLRTSKFYAEGFLMKRVDASPDGSRVAPESPEGTWAKWFVQLSGVVMSTWNAAAMEEAARQNRTVEPQYLKLDDAFLHPYRPDGPSPTEFQFALNVAGQNRLLFCAPSLPSLTMWINAIRLAVWERSRCNEIYTGSLLGTREPRPNGWGGFDSAIGGGRGRLEGKLEARLPGATTWAEYWVVVTKGQVGATKSAAELKKGRRTSLLSFNKKATMDAPPIERLPGDGMLATIAFYRERPSKKEQPVCIVQHAFYCAAIFPENERLVDKSTLFKLEGTFLSPVDGYAVGQWGVGGRSEKQGFAHIVVKDGDTMAMLEWIVGISDAFKLYGRPRGFSYDPRDPSSLYFALPVGPHRDRLFLDRELVDGLDIKEARPRAVRATFHNILFDRMRGVRPAMLPTLSQTGTPPSRSPPPPVSNASAAPPMVAPTAEYRRPLVPNNGTSLAAIGEQSVSATPLAESPAMTPSSSVSIQDRGATPDYLGAPSAARDSPPSEASDVLAEYGVYVGSDLSREPSRTQLLAVSGGPPASAEQSFRQSSSPFVTAASPNFSRPIGNTGSSMARSTTATPPVQNPAPMYDKASSTPVVNTQMHETETADRVVSLDGVSPPGSSAVPPGETVLAPAIAATPTALVLGAPSGAVPPRDAPQPAMMKEAKVNEENGGLFSHTIHDEPTELGENELLPVSSPEPALAIAPPPPPPTLPSHGGDMHDNAEKRGVPTPAESSYITKPLFSPPQNGTEPLSIDTSDSKVNEREVDQEKAASAGPEDIHSDLMAALHFVDQAESPSLSGLPPTPSTSAHSPDASRQTTTFVGPPSKVDAFKSPPSPVDEEYSAPPAASAVPPAPKPLPSSFAENKRAKERIATAQVTQAEQQAALSRPGRSGIKRPNPKGLWQDSDEDEVEEDDDDDDDDIPPPLPPRDSPPGLATSRGAQLGHMSAAPLAQDPYVQPATGRQSYYNHGLETRDQSSSSPIYDGSRQESPVRTTVKPIVSPHGLLHAGIIEKEERSARAMEQQAREGGGPLVSIPSKPPPPQTGLVGAITSHEREKIQSGGVGRALTEQQREQRLAQQRQKQQDEYEQRVRQQQHAQFGSFNPLMNSMMLNPWMMGGYPPMGGFPPSPSMGPGQFGYGLGGGSHMGGSVSGNSPRPASPMMNPADAAASQQQMMQHAMAQQAAQQAAQHAYMAAMAQFQQMPITSPGESPSLAPMVPYPGMGAMGMPFYSPPFYSPSTFTPGHGLSSSGSFSQAPYSSTYGMPGGAYGQMPVSGPPPTMDQGASGANPHHESEPEASPNRTTPSNRSASPLSLPHGTWAAEHTHPDI